MKCWGRWIVVLALAGACDGGDDDDVAANEEGSGDDGPGDIECFTGVDAPKPDITCEPDPEFYAPGTSAWPACPTDDGSYPLIADTPSSIARVVAYEDIMAMLAEPTPDAFTRARSRYAEDEGLESRLQRRENLRVPAIPESDWDPGVDADKQCTVAGNVETYPERCAGPAQIAPVINEAFRAGQLGEGVPEVHVARIDAAVQWFLYLSVYKEANTCFTSAAKDCDSSWAYYTGGQSRDGGIGLAAWVSSVSPEGHEAIWNGFSAFRCLRELYPDDEPMLDADGMQRFETANVQLAAALDHGLAAIVRAALVEQGTVCDVEAQANWAFLQILGPVLDREGMARDAAAYAPAAELWAAEAPSAEGLQAAIAALDAVFPCPA